jgi:hypothetical protein
MAIVWTSEGKRRTNSRAVGALPAKLGQNVLWENVADPTNQDVIDNQWPEGTIVYRVTQTG